MATLSETVKEIQKKLGVVADGIFGKNTAAAMLEFINANTDKEPEQSAPECSCDKEPESCAPVADSMAWDIDKDDAIDKRVHDICNAVLNVFETGSKDGDYSNVTIYKDGGGGAYRQITYGRSQTTQDGHLDELLNMYLDATKNCRTEAGDVIAACVPVKHDRGIVTNKHFIQALRDAGKERSMQQAQDELFDKAYFIPAYKWFKENGFTLPLSMLVIYDSFIHSGGILSFLRKRFNEVPPAKGGNEKDWIKAYVQARYNWLANHSNSLLRKTVYRMKTMQQAMKDDNWDLSKPVYANGIKVG